MTEMPPLALLAGGLAARLGELTRQLPKALLKVAGEPFIAHQLRLMRRERVPRVVICAGYLAEQIRGYVGDGSRFGIPVTYRIDGPKLLGTGGALRAALPELGEVFLVMYGDSWLDTAYPPIVEAFHESGQPALMTVFRNEGQWDTSNVWFENGRLRLYDKRARLPQMQHIDWGLGVIRAEVLASRPANEPFDLAEVYSDLSRRGKLAGYEVTTRFYEIGSAAGLKETDSLLRSRRG
ncbi:MAG: sugar phosphate nucleotidyltransferase [Xanthobacteraceae bacterium]